MRKREVDPIEAERSALAEQREALANLQRQLAERVAAVQARELELREAIARARNGSAPAPSANPTPPSGAQLRAPSVLPAPDPREIEQLRARVGELEARERALVQKAGELTERERSLVAQLSTAKDEAAARAALPQAPPTEPEQSAKIEAQLAVLRAAEEAFERTREELAARSEAVAARERLVGDRERELFEREDGWGNVEMHELESRLRRLEQQKTAPAPSGFSSGIRKLEQQSARRPKPTP